MDQLVESEINATEVNVLTDGAPKTITIGKSGDTINVPGTINTVTANDTSGTTVLQTNNGALSFTMNTNTSTYRRYELFDGIYFFVSEFTWTAGSISANASVRLTHTPTMSTPAAELGYVKAIPDSGYTAASLGPVVARQITSNHSDYRLAYYDSDRYQFARGSNMGTTGRIYINGFQVE